MLRKAEFFVRHSDFSLFRYKENPPIAKNSSKYSRHRLEYLAAFMSDISRSASIWSVAIDLRWMDVFSSSASDGDSDLSNFENRKWFLAAFARLTLFADGNG